MFLIDNNLNLEKKCFFIRGLEGLFLKNNEKKLLRKINDKFNSII